MSLGALRDMEEEPSMWIADQWQDYELLDCFIRHFISFFLSA